MNALHQIHLHTVSLSQVATVQRYGMHAYETLRFNKNVSNFLPTRHVSQFVVGFLAATETHTVPAVIPRHYHVTFLNCDTHSGLAVALLLRPL